MMQKHVVVLIAALCFASGLAHAQERDWRIAARLCAAEIDKQAGCTTACDNRLWPEYARCANDRLASHYPTALFEQCIRKIWNERLISKPCALCGDPVGEAFRCAGGV
jgi:hypothetical protein